MPMADEAPRLIGVDWGTSNLRAHAFDASGHVLDSRSDPRGMASIASGGFAQVLEDVLAPWSVPITTPVLICGMVGSRQGWAEAPYLPCPVDIDRLASAAITPPDSRRPIRIVPGLSTDVTGGADVARGEETQATGAIAMGAIAMGAHGMLIMPGTHSKWMRATGRTLSDFRTFMTGELHAVLLDHSLLGRMAIGRAEDSTAFAHGVTAAMDDPAITALLFTARSEALFGHIAPEAVSAYLSGLLIGAEVARGLSFAPDEPLTLIGSGTLTHLYATAFKLAEVPDVPVIDGDMASARGLWEIAQQIGDFG